MVKIGWEGFRNHVRQNFFPHPIRSPLSKIFCSKCKYKNKFWNKKKITKKFLMTMARGEGEGVAQNIVAGRCLGEQVQQVRKV